MIDKDKGGFGKLVKAGLMKETQKGFESCQHVFVTQFSNITVNAIGELRKNLRKQQTQFLVVKNSIGRKALASMPMKGLEPFFQGQCGMGLTSGDPAKISKILVTFGEENNGFKVGGAYIDGQIFSMAMVKQLATLPSREELLSKICGGLQSPITGMVTVLSQVLRGIVNVLDQIKNSKDNVSTGK